MSNTSWHHHHLSRECSGKILWDQLVGRDQLAGPPTAAGNQLMRSTYRLLRLLCMKVEADGCCFLPPSSHRSTFKVNK